MLVLVKNPTPETDTTVRLLAAVIFADIAGYTSLMQEDEERAILLRNRQRSILEEKIVRYDGEIRQYYGDGALCMFRSAVEAVRCAVYLQQEFSKKPAVPVRIGLHMGDIASDSQGIYGDAVNIASRIESLSTPGGILISGKIYDEIRNHRSIDTVKAGVFKLKSVKQRMEIFAVTNAGLAIPFAGMSHYSSGRKTIEYRSPLEVRKGRTRSTSALKKQIRRGGIYYG